LVSPFKELGLFVATIIVRRLEKPSFLTSSILLAPVVRKRHADDWTR
jgi:hypothetical protein